MTSGGIVFSTLTVIRRLAMLVHCGVLKGLTVITKSLRVLRLKLKKLVCSRNEVAESRAASKKIELQSVWMQKQHPQWYWAPCFKWRSWGQVYANTFKRNSIESRIVSRRPNHKQGQIHCSIANGTRCTYWCAGTNAGKRVLGAY